MTRLFSVLFFVFILTVTARGQFDAQFSQYMFNNAAFNPAAIGEGDLIQLVGQYRSQWIGVSHAPQSFVLDVNGPIKISQHPFGIGLRILNDKFGAFTNNTFHVQFAYKKQFDENTLSIGTDLGFVNTQLSAEDLKSQDQPVSGDDYHADISADPAIPKANTTGIGFDAGLGGVFKAKDYYLGLSISHINGTSIIWNENQSIKLYRTMYFTAGYNYPIQDTRLTLKPSLLVKSDFSVVQVDASCLLDYDSKYWGGLSYRYEDALILLFGLDIPGGYSFGCSVDWSIKPLTPWFSLEGVLMYSFNYVLKTRNARYKSIRLL
jgi:type IX secretion system PorP/SprF family membrane protein